MSSKINLNDIDFQKVYNKFIINIEKKVLNSFFNSWCLFCVRLFLYSMSFFVFCSTLYLFVYKHINSRDFAYIVPMSALSSATILFLTTKFVNQNKSDIIWDASIDVLTEFIPSSKLKNK